MRLRDIFENFRFEEKHYITDEYLNDPDAIDARFNRELHHFNKEQRKKYDHKNDGTHVTLVDTPDKDTKNLSNKPEDRRRASPGWNGRKFVQDFIKRSEENHEDKKLGPVPNNDKPLSKL